MSKFTDVRTYLRRKVRIALVVLSITDSRQNQRDLTGALFQTRDVGAGGVGVETLLGIESGDIVNLQFELPGGKTITAVAIIKNVRTEQRVGRLIYSAGLQYLQISDLDRKAVADFVGSGDFMI